MLPVPKFAIGDPVFVGMVESTRREVQCPDCLGTKKWKCITPAGEELQVHCPRCSNAYGVPHLHFHEATPRIDALTIGSVRIDTNADEGEKVAYMCAETGIGSGSIWYENRISATREEAEQRAAIEVAAFQAKMNTDPQWSHNKTAMEMSFYTLETAKIVEAESRRRKAERDLEHLSRVVYDLPNALIMNSENDIPDYLTETALRYIGNYILREVGFEEIEVPK